MDKLNMHTEEFNEVAKRIPDSYTSYIVYGLFIFIIILFVLGFLIDVPEKVNAETDKTQSEDESNESEQTEDHDKPQVDVKPEVEKRVETKKKKKHWWQF